MTDPAQRLGLPVEADEFTADGVWTRRDGVWRAPNFAGAEQRQTGNVFGYKWARRDTYESDVVLDKSRAWLNQRYGDCGRLFAGGKRPLFLDAGCGAGFSAAAWLGGRLRDVDYVGVDFSTAVEVAKRRLSESGVDGVFLQADLCRLPFPDSVFDVIFSEGVLHHTDDTAAALRALTRLLRPGGRMMFYVYRRKGPVREFTDDFIRGKISAATPEQGWDALMPLTKLGKALGELNIVVDVPEAVEVLDIPAGPIDVQRLFYWHVFKAFYDPNMSLDEMNHINFDWYAPKNARRHTIEEVREWCAANNLRIETENVEQAGITVVAVKD